MREFSVVRVACVCLAVFLQAPAVPLWAGPFQMGTSVIDITPPIGYRMSGYFHERLSTGVKDPLSAKAIVFSQDNTIAAIVFCDLVGIAPQVATQSRRAIAKQWGIPATHVSIAATHSHTGPLYWGAIRNQLHAATVAREGSDPQEVSDYPAFLTRRIVDAVGQAKQELEDVEISAGFGREDRIAFNRRFLLKNGLVKTWVGIRNPDVVRAAGPIDPDIGLIRFDSLERQESLAAITCYALHLDTLGGTEYSADYPYYLQQELARQYGDRFVSLFGIGACGDINHVDTAVKTRNSTDQIGQMLADAVRQAMPDLPAVTDPALAVAHAIVHVPKQQYAPEEIAQAEQDMAYVGDVKVPFPERVEAYKIIALQDYPGDEIPLEIHVFRLSREVAIVTLPGEVFVELGLQIKANSPFETTLVIELANDAPGYIPTRKAFAEGGYEAMNSRVAAGGGEVLAHTAVRLLREVHAK